MTTYKDLLKQREALEQQISEARERETSAAVAQVRALVADFGLTEREVFPSGKQPRAAGKTTGKVAPKYRHPETGDTWTGRGKPPKWMQGQDRAQFAI